MRILIALLTILLLAMGCSHTPAPDAGFIDKTDLLKPDEKLPFDEVWYKPGLDLRTYKKIYVAPVDATHLLKMSWWDDLSLSQAFTSTDSQSEAAVLAGYMQQHVIDAFKADKDDTYIIMDKPDKETLSIELALVEVVPTKVWLNAMSYVIAGALDTGSTAIEGRFRDGSTNEIIFRFKDKRAGPYSIVNVGDLTWYSHAKDTIQSWADELDKVCDRSPDQAVSSPFPFTLKPW